MKTIVALLLSFLLMPFDVLASTPVARDIRLATGTEVTLQVWPGKPQSQRLLWIGSDAGFPDGMQELAQGLNEKGVEVLQVDLLTANFLPLLPSSLDKVPARDLGELLQQMLKNDRRPLVLMADGLGAKLLVRAASAWRTQYQQTWPAQIPATVFLSPNLYVATPTAGVAAEYIKEGGALGGRIGVLQPQLSPLYWWLERLQKVLVETSATVEIKTLPAVRDRFYFRPDAFPGEQDLAKQLPELIYDFMANTKENSK